MRWLNKDPVLEATWSFRLPRHLLPITLNWLFV